MENCIFRIKGIALKSYVILNIGFIIISLLYIQLEPFIKLKERKYVMGLFVVFFSVLMAIRPTDTKDTMNYINAFSDFQSGQTYGINLLQKYNGFELGYIYLNRIFKIFSNNYRVFFFIITIAGVTLTIVALKRLCCKTEQNEKYLFGLIFSAYISYFGLLYNGISLRAGLAIGLGLTAVNWMIENKLVEALIFILLAVSIQRSAFLFVIIYFVIKFFPLLKMKVHLLIWFVMGIFLFNGIGSSILILVSNMLSNIISRYNISGFGAYLAELEAGIGLRDVYLWLLYGVLILFMNYSEYYMRYLNVIMIGTLIVVFLHDIRAIARIHDMFFVFMVPMLYYIYNEKTLVTMQSKRLMITGVMCINSMVMLKLCFW